MSGDFYEKRTVSDDNRHNISNAVSYASVATAQSLDAAVIIAPSISRYTARMLSKWHPSTKLGGNVPEYLCSPQDDALLGRYPVPGKKSGIH